MGIDRRNFMKTLGLAGVTITIGKNLMAAPQENNEGVEFYGVLYDGTICEGCQSCEYACAEANGLPEPEDWPDPEVKRKTSEKQRTVLNYCKTSDGEKPIKTQCMHCNQPACAAACLTKAMYKTKEGPVIWREDKCMGCRYCMVSCPFDVPKFEYNSTNPKIVKCTMCFDRVKDGGMPACAENCPAEAIKFGTRRELLAEARKRMVENPGRYVDHIYGEHEAGGTGFLYLSGVPFEELDLKTNIQNESYPKLTKGFISSIAPVDILLPGLLLGIHEATKNRNKNEED